MFGQWIMGIWLVAAILATAKQRNNVMDVIPEQRTGFDVSAKFLNAGDIIFECTIISDVVAPKPFEAPFSKLKKHSSIRLDAISSSELALKVAGRSLQISHRLLEHRAVGIDHEKIDVAVAGHLLLLELRGKPLSRKGSLQIQNDSSGAVLKASVTCH